MIKFRWLRDEHFSDAREEIVAVSITTQQCNDWHTLRQRSLVCRKTSCRPAMAALCAAPRRAKHLHKSGFPLRSKCGNQNCNTAVEWLARFPQIRLETVQLHLEL